MSDVFFAISILLIHSAVQIALKTPVFRRKTAFVKKCKHAPLTPESTFTDRRRTSIFIPSEASEQQEEVGWHCSSLMARQSLKKRAGL
jgi:hypothetical protein